jgi:hypothetical protein
MNWIDADAHVVESLHTWDYLEPSERKFRPAKTQYWLIDGKIRGVCSKVLTAEQFAELSRTKGRKMDQPQEARSMENVETRVRHLDELGIATPLSSWTSAQIGRKSMWLCAALTTDGWRISGSKEKEGYAGCVRSHF